MTSIWGNGGSSTPILPTIASFVNTVAALRNVSKTLYSKVFVLGYYAIGDGGGGLYYYDSTDLVSADNGGTIIVAADLGRWKLFYDGDINVAMFGAVSGVLDDTAAINAALATGKDVLVPAGDHNVTAPLTMSTPYQRLYGNGWASKINFTLTVSGNGINTSNSTGWQRITGLFLNGISNVAKMISVGSPDVTIEDNFIVNATATGHGIYLENENVGANIYCFDCKIHGNLIYGVSAVGNYGIYAGLNHQGLKVQHNSIQNWGNLININGATTSDVIKHNILQRSISAGVPGAIVISKAGSAMPAYNIAIEHNYFEQNSVCVYVDDADIQNLSVRGNYAYRNTATIVGSVFYKIGAATYAASTNIRVEDNRADSFEYFFSLNNDYASNFASVKGNTNVNATGYSTGAFSDKAYIIRQHNAYFGNIVASGAFTSQAVTREEAATCTFRIPFRWEPHEYLDVILIKYLRSAVNPSVTVNLHKVSIDTDTIVATSGAVSTDININIAVGAFAEKNYHYYLEFICTTVAGVTAYIYPAQAYIRG